MDQNCMLVTIFQNVHLAKQLEQVNCKKFFKAFGINGF